ncbi:MAG: hypothetical protein K9G49_09355 [Taibaiella sp.]|nr:hypothetical protein [Taibaiella sp.]
MKKALLFTTLLSIIVVFLSSIGCKKEEKGEPVTPVAPSYACTACTTTPEAKAANDGVSKGIYKGIIVGSSGTIKFDIQNNDSTIKAYMTLDGVAVVLTATVKWVAGASYVSAFTGTMNGQPVSITFSVDATGANPTVIAMSIPGHPNASLTLSKETSTNLIKCFEGTYKNLTTGKNGTFNLTLVTSLKRWYARSKEDGASSTNPLEGTFEDNTLKFGNGTDVSGTSTLSGDNIINGTWSNTSKPENGTWEGKRTL